MLFDNLFLKIFHSAHDVSARGSALVSPVAKTNPEKTNPESGGHLRVALVHDFFYVYGGAERVVEQIIHTFPQCDVFGLFDFLPADQRDFLQGKSITTSFLQKLPFVKNHHRSFLPLMPLAIEQLDVSQYDLVISSSYAVAKGVITGPDQTHVCYCHSPIRFAWDQHHQYLNEAGIGFGPIDMVKRAILHYVRNWDARSAMGVDHFIANSQFVARRIKKTYRRDATVIHPPVDTGAFKPPLTDAPRPMDGDYYLAASRLVSQKRIDLIVEAFAAVPDRKLVVVGDGPERARLEKRATPNVRFVGYQNEPDLVRWMQHAKAFVFAAEEDFGIMLVEAMACGTPVIAHGRGGARETILNGVTGVLFESQTAACIVTAIADFESQVIDEGETVARSRSFGNQKFKSELKAFLLKQPKIREFFQAAEIRRDPNAGLDPNPKKPGPRTDGKTDPTPRQSTPVPKPSDATVLKPTHPEVPTRTP